MVVNGNYTDSLSAIAFYKQLFYAKNCDEPLLIQLRTAAREEAVEQAFPVGQERLQPIATSSTPGLVSRQL